VEEWLAKTMVLGFEDHQDVRSELAESPEERGRRPLQRDPSEQDPLTRLGLHQPALARP
jgi:hypothetical protein